MPKVTARAIGQKGWMNKAGVIIMVCYDDHWGLWAGLGMCSNICICTCTSKHGIQQDYDAFPKTKTKQIKTKQKQKQKASEVAV